MTAVQAEPTWTTLHVRMPNELLADFDRLCVAGMYSTRAAAIRDLIETALTEVEEL